MSLLEEIMNNDSSVFKNQDIFNINYLPEIIYFRDKELKSILINIKPLLTNNKVLNTLIIGNSSTGKTTVIKHALLEIENYTDIKTCYINCNIQDTLRKCYFQIYKVLYKLTPRSNTGTEVIQELIMEKLEQEQLILVFDDLNHLSMTDSNKLVNEFFRANEFYHTNMAIIIIINNIVFRYSLEKNAQSILQCNEILFENYTEEEIYSILKARCKEGFKQGVINNQQIMAISQITAEKNDLRWGLTTLNAIGLKIESENRDKITEEDIRKYML
ncbi:MAG: hypothetical protein BZ138_04520 [Methanosphaera sp. rholeuAM270]|nr:MAG: hypothetical protein BZ138_04520 [Methanosphaera sp. rholeuAM270]